MSYSFSATRGISEVSPRPLRPGRRALRRVPWRLQTYRNILYLLASFPLGLCYFVFIVTGVCLALGLLVLWVGAPIFLVTMVAWWWLATLERELTIWWLRVDVRPLVRPRAAGPGFWRWLGAYLGNQTTWTSLVYLLVKCPLGAVSFALTVTLVAVTARLLAAPLPYLFDLATGTSFEPGALILGLVSSLAGIVIGLGSLYLLNGLAFISGQFARLMLGNSDLAARLSETTALAERERVKAERAERSRRQLVVDVSHELRTPTASIRGHVESLLMALDKGADSAPPPAELRQYLTIIQREAERLNSLVDELLPLARAEAGELRLEVAPVDAGVVVEEVYQALAPLARRERSITLVREVAPELPPALADRRRLAQVLLNLVRNAITYTPTGGIVSIDLMRAGADHLALTVADTGIGIPAEDLDRVFDRFYRTDASRARSSGGFGLGLAIVRDLVQAMGGTVTAESTVGEGSRFRVLLRTNAECGMRSAESREP